MHRDTGCPQERTEGLDIEARQKLTDSAKPANAAHRAAHRLRRIRQRHAQDHQKGSTKKAASHRSGASAAIRRGDPPSRCAIQQIGASISHDNQTRSSQPMGRSDRRVRLVMPTRTIAPSPQASPAPWSCRREIADIPDDALDAVHRFMRRGEAKRDLLGAQAHIDAGAKRGFVASSSSSMVPIVGCRSVTTSPSTFVTVASKMVMSPTNSATARFPAPRRFPPACRPAQAGPFASRRCDAPWSWPRPDHA